MITHKNYWAAVADPKRCDVEAALRNYDLMTWTVGDHDVRVGDWLLIWRTQVNGKRGIIGAAKVVSDPEIIPEPEQYRSFWHDKEGWEPKRRVWIHTTVPENAPLWLDEDKSGILGALSVARAGGGSMFHVTEQQWRNVTSLFGDWRAETASLDPAPAEIEVAKTYYEGAVRQVFVNAYERQAGARRACIKTYGVVCLTSKKPTASWEKVSSRFIICVRCRKSERNTR
ncbi:MAG: EVE domain-containing protein [Phycisphaerae bacterium]